MDLSQRDRRTVEYTINSALLEGDTLALINFPNNQPAYDPSGFQLSTVHRVHSEKLLATGSRVFREKLESEWLNHRAAKKAGVFPTLPEGIKYVIDLTPPEEGDDALELTANLSCSPGIRNWYNAELRLGVSRNLVAGKDESTMRQEAFSQPTSPTKVSNRDMGENGEPSVSELSTAVTSILNGETRGIMYVGVIPDQGPRDLSQRADRNAVDINGEPPGDVGHGERASVNGLGRDGEATGLGDAKHNVPVLHDEVLDYCPIRHRAGIERLLQVIEGKNPRLDSAPKMWTLAVLAKYFDCACVAVSSCYHFRLLRHITDKSLG